MKAVVVALLIGLAVLPNIAEASEPDTQVGLSMNGTLGEKYTWSLQERINKPGALEREIELGLRHGKTRLLGVYMEDDAGRQFAGMAFSWQKKLARDWSFSVAAVGYKNMTGGPDKAKVMATMTRPLSRKVTIGGVFRGVKKEHSDAVLELGGEISCKLSFDRPLLLRVQYLSNMDGGRHLYLLASCNF